MTTIPTSRVAERTGSKASPPVRGAGAAARCRGAFAAVVAAALVAYAGVAWASLANNPLPIPRVALVIGNGDYEEGSRDPSARNDAQGVGAALERLGFKVRILEDAGYVDMLQGLLEFSQEAQSAEHAVVFYAGQGYAVDGRNHLFPVDAPGAAVGAMGGDHDLDPDHHVTEGNLGLIPVAWLMRSVAGASNLRLVILDTDVFAPLEPAGGTIVAQAAAVGTHVHAGSGSSHSPYTEALLRYLEEPGLELGMLFRKVREDVMRATDGRRGPQKPVVYWPGSGVSLSPLPLSGQTPVVDLLRSAAKPERGVAEAVVEPGATFRDCPECPEMVVVPSGSFQMGSPESEEGRYDDEGPVHGVTIARPFAVGVYEVTFGEWNACVSGDGCVALEPSSPREALSHPVVNVSWSAAQAYVRWLSEKTGKAYRLLSEAEWEYVARAGTTGPYHFGSSLSPSQANYGDNSGRHGSGRELFGECVRAL